MHISLSDALEQIKNGEIKRLMVTTPPQHGKSFLSSIHFPCWLLGHEPKTRIAQTSYGLSLALYHSRIARDFFVSSEYYNLFPEVHHRPEKAGQDNIVVKHQAAQLWGTSQGGEYYAVGIGGSLTGRSVDVGIIDDPVSNPVEANSNTISERNWDWYSQVFRTRLSPKASVIVTATRWSQKDLLAKILDNLNNGQDTEDWKILHMPAIAIENNKNDPTNRKPGEALYPEKYDINWLLNQKLAGGLKAFESLYQGNPTVAEGNIFKKEWWQYYKELPNMDYIIQSWDTAFKCGNSSDFCAGQTWGVNKNGYYLIDIFHAKQEYPELLQSVKSFYEKHKPKKVIVEDAASGQSLIQSLKRETRVPLLPVKPDSDKISRANVHTGIIQAGKVFLPENHPLLYDFILECAEFPDGAHDDQVDSMSYALSELTGRKTGLLNLKNLPMGFGSIR